MMAIGFAMLSLFGGLESAGAELERFVYRFLEPTAGAGVRQYLNQFAADAGRLTLIGLGFFLLTALLLLNTIEKSFNDIWGVGEGRTLPQRLTVYWTMVSLGPLFMGGSLSISTYLLTSSILQSTELGAQVQNVGLTMLPFVFQMMAFALLYLFMPNVKVSFRHGLIGALVATILFETTKRLFGLYIVNFNNYEVVYGALSTLPIFLLWIYLSWVVALIGAEVVSVLQQRSEQALVASQNED
jgi:membrane protein